MAETFNIQVPFFVGFYESYLYNSDTLYNETCDEEEMEHWRDVFGDDTLTADDIDIDFPRYKEACSKEYVDAFKEACPNFVEKLTFTEVTSPRYYNFETDKVWADIELAEGWKEAILAFMDENKEWLTDRIKEDWSDRDGFWSYMDNSFAYWYKMFKGEEEMDERYISTMLGYMLYKENDNIRWDLCEAVLYDIYIGDFIINTKEQSED